MSDMTDDPRSLRTLLSDLVHEVTSLFRKEGELLRAEVSEKVTQIETGIGSAAAGVICLLGAFLVLLQALVVAITNLGLDAAWASLIVGVLVAIIGVILLKSGASKMSSTNLMPRRTAHQVEKDAHLAKEQTR